MRMSYIVLSFPLFFYLLIFIVVLGVLSPPHVDIATNTYIHDPTLSHINISNQVPFFADG
jgi:hypothetical protein